MEAKASPLKVYDKKLNMSFGLKNERSFSTSLSRCIDLHALGFINTTPNIDLPLNPFTVLITPCDILAKLFPIC